MFYGEGWRMVGSKYNRKRLRRSRSPYIIGLFAPSAQRKEKRAGAALHKGCRVASLSEILRKIKLISE
jgi:hypothetical protein